MVMIEDKLLLQERDVGLLSLEAEGLGVSKSVLRSVYNVYALKFIETMDNAVAYSFAMDELYFGERI